MFHEQIRSKLAGLYQLPCGHWLSGATWPIFDRLPCQTTFQLWCSPLVMEVKMFDCANESLLAQFRVSCNFRTVFCPLAVFFCFSEARTRRALREALAALGLNRRMLLRRLFSTLHTVRQPGADSKGCASLPGSGMRAKWNCMVSGSSGVLTFLCGLVGERAGRAGGAKGAGS